MEERGPKSKGGGEAGSSPPCSKQRKADGADEAAMQIKGVDPSAFATVRYLREELKTIIEETAEDQNKKFDSRFEKLEKKLQVMAKVTDGGMKNVKDEIQADREALQKWQMDSEERMKKVEQSLKEKVAHFPELVAKSKAKDVSSQPKVETFTVKTW